MNCNKKPIVIYQGFGTKWNETSLLTVTFDTEISLTGFIAEFLIGGIKKNYENIEDGFTIDLIASETATLPLGPITGTLIIIDRENNKRPFSTEIPFLVKDWEEGDIELDGFNLSIDTKIQDNKLTINIQTTNPDSEVDTKILIHNESETAHPYIRGLISNEEEARQEADNNLQTQINALSVLANGYVHEQGVASSVWNVQHNLNKYPSVTVVDSAENEIVAEVKYNNKNNVTITMKGASKGKAYLN